MHIKTKYKESLKTLYTVFESSVKKMGKEVQDQIKSPKRSTQKSQA